jgi:hypothetical protein
MLGSNGPQKREHDGNQRGVAGLWLASAIDTRTKQEHDRGQSTRNSSMFANPKPHPQSRTDALEIATDQAIAACDGDLRATVQALIVAIGLLESELNDVCAATSKGYARGKMKREQSS